jgi:hypothetical protein
VETRLLDFLSPADRANHHNRYAAANPIRCDTAASFLQNLGTIRSDTRPLIIQILAHGADNGTGLGNRAGERVSWPEVINALAAAKTMHPIRLNLLLPCYSDTIAPHLPGCTIDSVWVNTSGANFEFVASLMSNDYDDFTEFMEEVVDGLVETEYREFLYPYTEQEDN